MKNQYFGDINDYRKYGLLRAIQEVTGFRTLVAWLLTPDDDGPDGNFTNYIDESQKYTDYDHDLYEGIRSLMSNGQERAVSLIEGTDLLPCTEYFSEIVPSRGPERGEWFAALQRAAEGSDLVFLDPDNGIEVKSRPFGRKDSSKFVFWREIETLWSAGW